MQRVIRKTQDKRLLALYARQQGLAFILFDIIMVIHSTSTSPPWYFLPLHFFYWMLMMWLILSKMLFVPLKNLFHCSFDNVISLAMCFPFQFIETLHDGCQVGGVVGFALVQIQMQFVDFNLETTFKHFGTSKLARFRFKRFFQFSNFALSLLQLYSRYNQAPVQNKFEIIII